MKDILRWLVFMGIVLQYIFSSAFAEASKADPNVRKAVEYISQLKAGANPDNLKRPQLRYLRGYNAKQLNKQLRKAMDDAEALARAGKQDEIKEIEVVKEDANQGRSTY